MLSCAAARRLRLRNPTVRFPRLVPKTLRGQAADLSGPDPHAAEFLGEARLPHPAALRCRDGRGHVSPGDNASLAGAAAVARGVCAAVAAPEGRTLWRKSESVA